MKIIEPKKFEITISGEEGEFNLNDDYKVVWQVVLRETGETLINKRRRKIKELRDKVGVYDLGDYKPLSKAELHDER